MIPQHDGMPAGSVLDGDLSSRLQVLIDALPFYVMLIDKHHRILLANTMVHRHYGVAGDILLKACPGVIHGVDNFPHCPLQRAIDSGEPVEVEFLDDGSGYWLSSGMYPTAYTTESGDIVYLHTAMDITARKTAEMELKRSLEKSAGLAKDVINVITRMVETRDPYTAGHQLRVSRLAKAIALDMGLPADQAEGVGVAGLVHDVGKIAVPIEILSKPGKLSREEFMLVRGHAEAGYNILASVQFPWPVAQAVHQHHERMNGSGYPRCLKSDDIIVEARILAVADVLEAMSSRRPYRAALGLDPAIDELNRNSGVLYDPDVVTTCLRLIGNGFVVDAEGWGL